MDNYGYGLNLAREMSYPTIFANSTLLLSLLVSLMKEPHTPKTRNTYRKVYDYVIVGGGTAGSVLANRLSEDSGQTVLLVESGIHAPLLTNVPHISTAFWQTDMDWNYFTVPLNKTAFSHNNQRIPFITGKGLGGCTNINAMLYVRGNSKNYDEWSRLGASSWDYNQCLKYFKISEDNQNPDYANDEFHGVGGPVSVSEETFSTQIKIGIQEAAKRLGYRSGDSNGIIQTGFYEPKQVTVRNGQRCSAAKAYLVPAENRTNLDIALNAHVTKIHFTKDPLWARAITVVQDGKEKIVAARREIILSAGALNTPQILMLSGIGPRKELEKHGIEVLLDLPVGKNFMDHPSSFLTFVINQPRSANEVIDSEENILQYINNKTGPLSTQSDDGGMAFFKKDQKTANKKNDFPNFEIYFDSADAPDVKTIYGIKKDVYESYYAPLGKNPLLICQSQLMQPKSRGTITLNSTDPFDPPLIDPNYYDDPQDLEDILDGFKACQKMAESDELKRLGVASIEQKFPGCESFSGDDHLRCIIRNIVVTTSHHCGTARMGKVDSKNTVVDPWLNVKGVRALRVIDASIMPKIPSGNTMTPVYMIAEKGFYHVQQNHYYTDRWLHDETCPNPYYECLG